MRFSYTALKSFVDCPKAYYFRYVKHEPVPETPAALYGTILHQTIKHGFDFGLPKPALLKLFKKSWVVGVKTRDIQFSSDTEYIDKLKEGQYLLGKFYNTYVDGQLPPRESEHRFNDVTLGDHTLVGIIDCITQDGRVIDFKSGRYLPDMSELNLDLQFTIYSYAYRQIYNEVESELVLANIRHQKELVTHRTPTDFDNLRDTLDNVAFVIENEKFYRVTGRHCSWCPFAKACLNRLPTVQSSSWRDKMNQE